MVVFIVRCRVSGGVTGTRESVCKENGSEIYFETEEDAVAYAREQLERTMGNPFRSATFQYWVDQINTH